MVDEESGPPPADVRVWPTLTSATNHRLLTAPLSRRPGNHRRAARSHHRLRGANYVIDAPGGGGKIPLQPNYVVGRDGDDLLLRNFRGDVYRYPDPV